MQARGKSGPLFHFDVHEDIRMQHDARIEKDESHAGKVVERHWYSKCEILSQHCLPAGCDQLTVAVCFCASVFICNSIFLCAAVLLSALASGTCHGGLA